jgi:hypothetical protein
MTVQQILSVQTSLPKIFPALSQLYDYTKINVDCSGGVGRYCMAAR